MSDKIQLKDAFTKNIEVTKKGEVTVSGTAFKDVLQAADITEKQYRAVKDLDATIASDMTQVLADKALPVFKANKDLETVSAKMPTVGRDFFEVSIDRTGKYRNPADGSQIVKHGIVNLTHSVIGTRKGEYGGVKKSIGAQWTEALKS